MTRYWAASYSAQNTRVAKDLVWGVLAAFMLLCVSTLALAAEVGQVAPQPSWPVPVADMPLDSGPEHVDLEFAVVVFDPGPVSVDERDARYKVRDVEARLAAALLRDTMAASQRFGPVRVLPKHSQFAAVTVTGEILHSDGRDSVVAIRVVDAAGRAWVAETFRAAATLADYHHGGTDPFARLFVAITNAIWAKASALTVAQVTQLKAIAELRYAHELAPEFYADYFVERDGEITLQRLPAENDPMVARIERIRNQEALFIDTVDEQYVILRETLGPTYKLWRRSGLEQALYLESYQQRARERTIAADRGTFAAMQQIYSTYRSVRIQEQDLFELATGFDNETAPTIMASGERVVRLEGTLEQQYNQWRQLLARIIRLERGIL